MVSPRARMSTRPAPERQPATSGVLPTASLKGPSLIKGPVKKNPWVRPISTPLSVGETPVRYAGRLLKKFATIGAEVTGVSIIPMKGSPLIGLTTWFFGSAALTRTRERASLGALLANKHPAFKPRGTVVALFCTILAFILSK